jgi:hypothetical protein
MKDNIFFVMDIDGVKRMTKKPPKLAGDERSVMISVEVEDSVFDYSFMKSKLTIKEDDVLEPSLEVQLLHANDEL